jgi:hypothetical protein
MVRQFLGGVESQDSRVGHRLHRPTHRSIVAGEYPARHERGVGEVPPVRAELLPPGSASPASPARVEVHGAGYVGAGRIRPRRWRRSRVRTHPGRTSRPPPGRPSRSPAAIRPHVKRAEGHNFLTLERPIKTAGPHTDSPPRRAYFASFTPAVSAGPTSCGASARGPENLGDSNRAAS